MKSAYLLIDARGPEIHHRSGLTAPDPFIYLAQDNETPLVFFDAREFEVMKTKLSALNNGVGIERLEPFQKKITNKEGSQLVAVAATILKDRGIEEARVSGLLPYAWGQQLEAAGLKVTIYNFGREREHKNENEIAHLLAAQRVNESAFALAWQILADSTVEGKEIRYKGQTLTSEFVKAEIRKHFLGYGYDCPDGIIVASGEQSAQPHNEGSGPLLPHECIIIDIFPRNEQTGFFADMTRTFVKREPSKAIKELFSTVEKVQHTIAESIAIGQACSAVHQQTIEEFKKLGHETSPERGFMHGAGHGLGLGLHEAPFLNNSSTEIIEPGMVVTVEPGLYYHGVGGVRVEDVVIFHSDGRKENITQFNKPSFIL